MYTKWDELSLVSKIEWPSMGPNQLKCSTHIHMMTVLLLQSTHGPDEMPGEILKALQVLWHGERRRRWRGVTSFCQSNLGVTGVTAGCSKARA
jgi:hypothetical protein